MFLNFAIFWKSSCNISKSKNNVRNKTCMKQIRFRCLNFDINFFENPSCRITLRNDHETRILQLLAWEVCFEGSTTVSGFSFSRKLSKRVQFQVKEWCQGYKNDRWRFSSDQTSFLRYCILIFTKNQASPESDITFKVLIRFLNKNLCKWTIFLQRLLDEITKREDIAS